EPVGEGDLVGHEDVVADHHAAVAGEHGPDQGAEVADLDFPPRPQVEERPGVDAAVAADPHRPGPPAPAVHQRIGAVQPAPLPPRHVVREGARQPVVGRAGSAAHRSSPSLTARAGLPANVAPAGTSRVTTAPAATRAPAPTRTPLRMIAPMPIQAPSSI